MTGSRVVFAVATVLSLWIVAGCGPTVVREHQVIDGWSVGAESPCTEGAAVCAQLLTTALDGFHNRDPFHVPVVSTEFHDEGLYRHGNGELGPSFRSGGTLSIVVFGLADGSARAIAVGWLGVGHPPEPPMTLDYGPDGRDVLQ